MARCWSTYLRAVTMMIRVTSPCSRPTTSRFRSGDGSRASNICSKAAPQLPGVVFNSVMSPISEAASPPVPPAGKGGIRNGLYSIHIRMLDGIDGGNTGVMVLHDGRIRGGDAFFDYIGACTSANGKWKGELVNHEHTASQGERPVFGGYEVGIGFSGTYTDEGAVAEATALAGKRSIRFSAVLKKLAKV